MPYHTRHYCWTSACEGTHAHLRLTPGSFKGTEIQHHPFRWGSDEPICNSLLPTASRQLVLEGQIILHLGFKGQDCGNKGTDHESGQTKANLNEIQESDGVCDVHQYTSIKINMMAVGKLSGIQRRPELQTPRTARSQTQGLFIDAEGAKFSGCTLKPL